MDWFNLTQDRYKWQTVMKNSNEHLGLLRSIYLSRFFLNSCHHLPETKRHSSLFLHFLLRCGEFLD